MSYLDRQAQALEIANAAGAEVLVCADPAGVHWLSGVAPAIETGPSPFAAPPAVLLAAGEPARLIAASEDLPAELDSSLEAVAYEGFSTGPLDGIFRGRELLLAAAGARRAAVDSLGARAMAPTVPEPVDVTGALVEARAVKDAAGIAAMRRAIAATDAGQEAARGAVAGGADEIGILAAARTAIEAHAGERVPLSADLLSGPRAGEMGGGPTARTPRPGETVLCDLAPRIEGTWGDSCATFVLGDPGEEIAAAHRKVREALERTIEAIRPGAVAGEIDTIARAGLNFPHHTGHGIGSSYYEWPRLVPGADTTLREDMVIALEPAIYAESFGIRLEHVVRVTGDGCEVMSTHRLELG